MGRSVALTAVLGFVCLILAACGTPEIEKPSPGKCLDVTTIDSNWGNDMWCARDDGTTFHTSYEGAELWTQKHVLPFSGRRDSDPCTPRDQQYVRCTLTDPAR